MARSRSPHLDDTVVRRIDVARAFAKAEAPTRSPVRVLVPLDAVPALTMPPALLPWADLGDFARQVLLRVDGATPTMRIVSALSATPYEGARELASLARKGLVRLTPAEDLEPLALEMDLAAL